MTFYETKDRREMVNWAFGNGCDCRYWNLENANPFVGNGDLLKEIWDSGWHWQDVWGKQRADEA